MAAFDDLGTSRSVVYYDEYGRPRLSKDPPTFCAGSTEDEINRAHEGDRSVFVWDPGRHKEAKNPSECETKRLYDLATDRWYRESPGSLLKNLGAGIINAVVPGGDLGDTGSSTQILGRAIGSVAGLAINPVKSFTNLTNTVNLGAIGNGIFGAVKTAFNLSTTPLGSLITGVVGQAIAPTSTGIVRPATTVAAAGQAPFMTNYGAWPSSSETKKASDSAFGSSTSTAKTPWYIWLAVAALPAGLLLYVIFKRKR